MPIGDRLQKNKKNLLLSKSVRKIKIKRDGTIKLGLKDLLFLLQSERTNNSVA